MISPQPRPAANSATCRPINFRWKWATPGRFPYSIHSRLQSGQHLSRLSAGTECGGGCLGREFAQCGLHEIHVLQHGGWLCRAELGYHVQRFAHCSLWREGRQLTDTVAASRRKRKIMFIAMNRFRVKKGSEEAFEKLWLTRETHLDRVPGFVEFHLLKGSDGEDHTLYASHTIWQSKSAFEAWTRSEEFRAAHARAGNETTGPLYLEHPKFEGFEVRQTVTRKAAVA